MPEHCVSSALTVSVKESSGTLKDKTILALRLTFVAFSEGSRAISSGFLSKALSGFITGTRAVSPQPGNNPVNRNKWGILILKSNKWDMG